MKHYFNKILFLGFFLLIKFSAVLGYHDTQTGGSSIPLYESMAYNMLYLVIPFLGLTFLSNELLQAILDRRFRSDSFKSGEDYLNYTVTASIGIVFILFFTRVFHGLPGLSDVVYGLLMSLIVLLGLFLRYREKIFGKLEF